MAYYFGFTPEQVDSMDGTTVDAIMICLKEVNETKSEGGEKERKQMNKGMM